MDSAERSRKRAQRWSKRKPSSTSPSASSSAPSRHWWPPVARFFRLAVFSEWPRHHPCCPRHRPPAGRHVTRPDEDGMLQEASLTRLGHAAARPAALVWIVVGAEQVVVDGPGAAPFGVMFRHLTYAVGKNNATTTTAVNIATNNNTRDAHAPRRTSPPTRAPRKPAPPTPLPPRRTALTTPSSRPTTRQQYRGSQRHQQHHVEASATNTTTRREEKHQQHHCREQRTNNNRNASEEADLQRNVALSHIERHRLAGGSTFAPLPYMTSGSLKSSGRLAWPTATVSSADQRVTLQGPTCNSSQITGWYSKASGTNETHRAPVAAAQDAERFINSNSSSEAALRTSSSLYDKWRSATAEEHPSDCSESRVMMWHLNMPKVHSRR
ncbi:hypothetical protein ZWY2020_054597 [Hordeum vulgare]|nr:hypothetical protein ZWY2020_054597 [Hordeum vulgare]